MEKEKASIRINFWTWLSREKDSIKTLATILQAVAILVGVMVVANEFIVKDRQAQETRVARALELFRGQSGYDGHLNLGDLIFEVIGSTDDDALKIKYFKEEKEFSAAVDKVIRRYTEIQSCLKTNTCDEELINHLFCTEAIQDSFVAYKLIIKPPGWNKPNYDARLDNLFDFTLNCLHQKNSDKLRWGYRRSVGWDTELNAVFSQLEDMFRQAEKEDRTTRDE